MIIQIRGTSGSGKSTAMRAVMNGVHLWDSVRVPGRKAPLMYRTPADSEWGRVVVLGHYETPCGGCDTVGSARQVYELIKEVVGGNGEIPILCEGLLLSEDTKWTGLLAEEGHDLTCLFLTTSLDECLARVRARRAAAGNHKPLSETNTARRVGTIEKARVKLSALGVNCRRCSAEQATKLVMNLLRPRGEIECRNY